MKTNSPTLKIIQLDQPNKEGLYPIVVRAHWNGRAERRTGIALPKSAWSVRTSTVKSTYPNAQKLNQVILAVYNQALQRKLALEHSGEVYTVKDIFGEVEHQNRLDIDWLVKQMIKERGLAFGTAKTLNQICSVLKTYSGQSTIILTTLNSDYIQAFGRYLSAKGLNNSTIVDYLYRISNMWNYAISKKYIAAGLNPFLVFNPRRVYKSEVKKHAITKEDLESFKDILKDFIKVHRNNMSVFDDVRTNEFAIAMYILGYTFGGLAFVDMANLRKEQIVVKEIDGKRYYSFNEVRRQKTHHPVPITIAIDDITRPLIDHYLLTPGDYLFPIIDKEYTPKELHKRMNSVEKSVNLHLRKVTGMDITYYSCRHTFASLYLVQPGASPIYLASMMGRSINGIWRYVQDVYSDNDMIRERMRMGL